MHSGVYSKSETPVNLTLTSSPVESFGRTVMVSLMFWEAGEARGGVTPECATPNSAVSRSPRGWMFSSHLLEIQLQPLRGVPGLGGQDAIPCKAAGSPQSRHWDGNVGVPVEPPPHSWCQSGDVGSSLTQMCHQLLGRDHLLLRGQLHLGAARGDWGSSPRSFPSGFGEEPP